MVWERFYENNHCVSFSSLTRRNSISYNLGYGYRRGTSSILKYYPDDDCRECGLAIQSIPKELDRLKKQKQDLLKVRSEASRLSDTKSATDVSFELLKVEIFIQKINNYSKQLEIERMQREKSNLADIRCQPEVLDSKQRKSLAPALMEGGQGNQSTDAATKAK